MSDELESKTDAELNELFAVEVAGWRWHTFPNGALPSVKHWKDADDKYTSIHTAGNVCTDANAVLPWLEKHPNAVLVLVDGAWHCDLNCEEGAGETFNIVTVASSEAKTFARAAVLALIRAKRAK